MKRIQYLSLMILGLVCASTIFRNACFGMPVDLIEKKSSVQNSSHTVSSQLSKVKVQYHVAVYSKYCKTRKKLHTVVKYGKVQSHLIVQLGHYRQIYQVAFSPDGNQVLTLEKDGTAHVWDTQTGLELRVFGKPVSGERVLGTLDKGVSILVSLNSMGTHFAVINPYSNVIEKQINISLDTASSFLFRFTNDIRWMYTEDDQHDILLWDTNHIDVPKHRMAGHNKYVPLVVISPDMRFLLTASLDHTLRLWSMSNDNECFRINDYNGSDNIGFSPDGKQFFVVNGKRIQLWSIKDKKSRRPLIGHRDTILTYAWSHDSQRLLTGSLDTTARLWDVRSGQVLRTFDKHTGPVGMVTFSKDDKRALTGSWDTTARVWDTGTGACLFTLRGQIVNASVGSFSPDGSKIITSINNTIGRIWSGINGNKFVDLKATSSQLNGVEFSDDSNILALGNQNRIDLLSTSSGQVVRSIPSGIWSLYALDLSNRVNLLVAGDGSGNVILSSVNGIDKDRKLKLDNLPISCVALSPNGARIAAASMNGKIQIWNTTDGVIAGQFQDRSPQTYWLNGPIVRLRFINDTRLIAATASGYIKILDNTATEVDRFEVSKTEILDAVLVPSTGYLRIIDSKGVISTWDVNTKKPLSSIKADYSRQLVYGRLDFANFSSDGACVLVNKRQEYAYVLECSSGRILKQLQLRGMEGGAFSPDGNWLTTTNGNGSADLWSKIGNAPLPIMNIALFNSGALAITNSNGKFDVNNIEDVEGLRWLFTDDPYTPLSVEAFMRNYYEPHLMPHLLATYKKPQAQADGLQRPLSSLNRVQPLVRIVSTKADGMNQDGYPTVSVTVQVDSVRRTLGNGRTYISGARDIRLFRDKQVVGACPNTEVGGSLDAVKNDRTLIIKKHAHGTVTYTKVFHGIELPRNSDGRQAVFTAYAFNDDDVKSQNSEPVSVPLQSEADAKLGTAYVVSIGMGTYDNHTWDLPYAASDADRLNTAVCKALGPDGRQFDRVSGVTLTGAAATKEHVKDLLMILAGLGDKLSAAERDAVDPKHELSKVHPDDFLFLSFCTHGFTDYAGTYYLLSTDTGEGEGLVQTPKLKKHCITDADLSYWLRDVDAGRMAMVVDACRAGAVAGLDFKPGPMGSRGMGQLAYDKGMRLLASTQASSVALEVGGDIKSGLLTHALLEDGLLTPALAGKSATLGEWLSGAVADVPRLYAALPKKVEGVVNLGGVMVINAKTMGDEPSSSQTPQLFDFVGRLPDQKDVALFLASSK